MSEVIAGTDSPAGNPRYRDVGHRSNPDARGAPAELAGASTSRLSSLSMAPSGSDRSTAPAPDASDELSRPIALSATDGPHSAGPASAPNRAAPPADPRWRRLAIAAIGLWFVSIVGAWVFSRSTSQLPVSDVVGFVREAGRFWDDLSERGLGAFLEQGGGARPVGTSILGYPFGFGTDFRAFYWRTLAIPAALGVIATVLVALAAGSRLRSVETWLLAAAGGALPMWWMFDDVRERDAQWGTPNGFTAGLIALATGLLLYGWRRERVASLALSFAVAATTPFLQEAGLALITGHAILAVLLLGWSHLADGRPITSSVRWIFSIGLAVDAVLWFILAEARYVEDGDPLRWGMSFSELHAFERVAPLGVVAADFVHSTVIYGFGLPALFLAIAGCATSWSERQRPWWIIALAGVALLGLLVNFAIAWTGLHVQRVGMFMPAMAVFWILCCPAVLELWKLRPSLRWVAVASSIVLAASVWIPGVARALHPATGYATFLDADIAATKAEVRAGLDRIDAPASEAIVFHSRLTPYLEHEAVARQEILGPFEPGTSEDRDLLRRDVRLHEPRLALQMLPHVQPHEVAFSDYILTLGPDENRYIVGSLWRGVRSVSQTLHSPEARALTEVVAENPFVTVLRPVDRVGLERLLVARLQGEGLLDPRQTGPVEPTSAPGVATFETGDVLVDGRAEWRPNELRIETTWAGTRTERGQVVMRIALLGQDGKPFLWLPAATLIPPPAASDDERYRRTIVNNLQRRGLRARTAGVAIALYSGDSESTVRANVNGGAQRTGLVPIPVAAAGGE